MKQDVIKIKHTFSTQCGQSIGFKTDQAVFLATGEVCLREYGCKLETCMQPCKNPMTLGKLVSLTERVRGRSRKSTINDKNLNNSS